MSITGNSSGKPWITAQSSQACTNSPQSVCGLRAGETGGSSALRGPGLMMSAMRRMSPPQCGHARGNCVPTRAVSMAHVCARGVMRTDLAAGGAIATAETGSAIGSVWRAIDRVRQLHCHDTCLAFPKPVAQRKTLHGIPRCWYSAAAGLIHNKQIPIGERLPVSHAPPQDELSMNSLKQLWRPFRNRHSTSATRRQRRWSSAQRVEAMEHRYALAA
jgi:hypothetical protein